MSKPRPLPNPPIPGEPAHEHIRNGQMIVREVMDSLGHKLRQSGDRAIVGAKTMQDYYEQLMAADKRFTYAVAELEGRRGNPPAKAAIAGQWSEVGTLREIGMLLRQVKAADADSHERILEIAFIIGQLIAQIRSGVHVNPPSKAGRAFISAKIAKLAHEGVPAPKRIAEAIAIARSRGFKGISLPRGRSRGRLRGNPAQLAILGLNPPISVDRGVDPIEAEWAELQYQRPDDPDGEDVVRVHEFPKGFTATPLTDGRVLLSGREGERLWTAE